MKNLELFRRRRAELEIGDDGDEVVALALDTEHERGFFLCSSSTLYWAPLNSSHQRVQQCLYLADEMQQGGGAVGMEYVVESESLIIGLANGDLLQVELGCSSPNIQVVGSMQGGMLCMAASPDGELVGVVTGLGQLLLLTPDFDILLEVAMARNGAHFHATHVQLSWRGDAKYFATSEYVDSSLSPGESESVIKIWERETGKLSSSFHTPGHAAMAWWNTRLAVAEDGAAPSVHFYERNGLEKDSFRLTAPGAGVARVESLQWDAGGEVLQVLVRCDQNLDAVQLWSCSSYHWYLKQEWRHKAEERVKVLWHPEKPLCGISWTPSGGTEVKSLGWSSAVVDNSVALVIDGLNVLVTRLDVSIIPPPLFGCKVVFPAPVNAVTLATDGSTVVAGLSDGSLARAFLPEQVEAAEDVHGVLLTGFNGFVTKLAAVSSAIFCLTRTTRNDQPADELLKVESSRTGEEWRLESLEPVPLVKPLVAIARGSSDEEVFIQLDEGSIFALESTAMYSGGMFSSECPWMQAVHVQGRVQLVGLDERGKLHLGSSIISDDCTSFAVHHTPTKAGSDVAHLVYTTRQDQLHIVNLSNSNNSYAPEVLDVSSTKKTQQKNFNIQRVWERGARIVTTLGGGDVAVILQTGRGNLETIYPRGLILQALSAMLADHLFREAITCARRHRIDLNVIVDFVGAPEFARLASEFVKQVGKLSLVTELVSSLRSENVLEATYQKTLSSLSVGSGASSGGSNKVQVVLEALREAVEKDMADTPARELCMLSIFARNDPPLVDEALKRIKKLREDELGAEQKSGGKLSAEAALKHLIWLADEKAVFNAALGLYDLHLAAMVASGCQRDPKEFLPFLQELEDMPSHVMRYTIDCKLHRYGSALQNLSSAGEAHFDEALELVRQHPELFPLALSMFKEEKQRRRVLEAWGDNFVAQEKFEDAAMSYMASSQLPKAMAAYRGGGLWQGVLTVAGQLKMTSNEVRDLAAELREELQAMGRPREAARVALDYCHDLEGGIAHLTEARDWMEALRVCYLRQREELVHKVLLPSAVECYAAMVAQFEEGMEKVGKYCSRFSAVRQRRVALEAKLLNADTNHDRDDRDDDTMSEASSNLSGMSVYSHGTARTSTAATTRRIRARRQGKIRAGSPGEEVALAEHLRGMAMSPQVAEELRGLLQALVVMGREDLSCKLHKVASKFEAEQAEAMRVVGGGQGGGGKWGYQALERGA